MMGNMKDNVHYHVLTAMIFILIVGDICMMFFQMIILVSL